MKTQAVVAFLALSSLLVACGERSDSPIKTGTTGALTAPAAAAQPAPSDRETPAAATPLTHAQAPQPAQGEAAAAAPTARDTPASGPLKEMTAAEESKSMPKPGQTDNHFTPSIDGATKGSQQSSGTPPPPAPAK